MSQCLLFCWILCVLLLAGSTQATSALVLSISHRGGSLYAPENTIAAFTNSLPVTDWMETDSQIINDGKFVTMPIAGPFLPISGLAPAALGGGSYRHDYSPTNNSSGFFRIEGL